MRKHQNGHRNGRQKAAPILHQRREEVQAFGTIVKMPIALPEVACDQAAELLNQILADTMTLRDLYKKHHWQVTGPTFYPLHLLFDKHYDEQVELIDAVAERIQTLGGVSVAMAADVAEMSNIQRPPRGREAVPVQLSRLLEAHEILIKETRFSIKKLQETGDETSVDILVSSVLRTHELQVWFLSQHLVPMPAVESKIP